MLYAFRILYYLQRWEIDATKFKWSVYCKTLHLSVDAHFREKYVVDGNCKCFNLFCGETRAGEWVGEAWKDTSFEGKLGLVEVKSSG